MAVDTKITDALDLQTLNLPPQPKVLSVEAEDYMNADGDPALRITVVLAPDTELAAVSGTDVRKLKSAIGQSLRNRGITLFPYIFLEIEGESGSEDED
jgi:hypothetical protein